MEALVKKYQSLLKMYVAIFTTSNFNNHRALLKEEIRSALMLTSAKMYSINLQASRTMITCHKLQLLNQSSSMTKLLNEKN